MVSHPNAFQNLIIYQYTRMKNLIQILSLFAALFIFNSCQRDLNQVNEIGELNKTPWDIEVPENFFKSAKIPGVAYPNNTEKITTANTTQSGENPGTR